MRRTTPYGLTLLGLLVGLTVLLTTPLSTATRNYFVGGAFLALAVASVTYLIVVGMRPGKRGPDF